MHDTMQQAVTHEHGTIQQVLTYKHDTMQWVLMVFLRSNHTLIQY